MPILLGISAVGVFTLAVLAALVGEVTPTVAVHAALGVGALPLIGSAMLHFVPVLTRSAGASPGLARLPFVLQGAGLLALFFVAGQGGLGVLHGAAVLAWGAAAALAGWLLRRAGKALGTPHPGWRWYLAALLCLLAGLAAIVAAYLWPQQYTALRAAHVRLNLFGFVGLTALGTLHVLLPTVFGAPDPRTAQRLRQDLGPAVGGVLALAGAAFMPTANGVVVGLAGVALLAACALRLAWAWGRAYGRRLGEDAVTLLLCVALAGWLLSLLCLGLDVSGAMSAGTRLPLVFVIAFMLPLVSGALSQLIPVWAHPGRLTPERLACRAQLTHAGPVRALLHLGAAFAAATGAMAWAFALSGAALSVLLLALARAARAGLLSGARRLSA